MVFLPLYELLDKGYTLTEIAKKVLSINSKYSSLKGLVGRLSQIYRGGSVPDHLRVSLVDINKKSRDKTEQEKNSLPEISKKVMEKAEEFRDTSLQKLGGLYSWATTGKLLTRCQLYIGDPDSPIRDHFTKARFSNWGGKPKLKELFDYMMDIHNLIYPKHDILNIKGLGFHSTKTKTKSIGILDGRRSEMYPYDTISDKKN